MVSKKKKKKEGKEVPERTGKEIAKGAQSSSERV